MKKFYAVIGNPPYQENQENSIESGNKNFAPPIYHMFLDESYKISDKVELIHPARFLFNAGSTPADWNRKMLNDEHLSIPFYEKDSDVVFPGLSTPLKGGVAVSYHDNTKNFGAIEVFTPYPELNTISNKVRHSGTNKSLMDIIFPRTAYRLTKEMHLDYPEAEKLLAKGHLYDMSSNIFSRLPMIFFDDCPNKQNEYIRILGRDSKRVYKYIKRRYVNDVDNLDKYKVFVTQVNGDGNLAEVWSDPIVEGPGVGATETFISIGAFNAKYQADNALKYIKTKFARALLHMLKVTPMNNRETWKYVPLQDFSKNSDIDWTKPVSDIDKQLYAKYGLNKSEISFVETNVKGMT